MNVADLIWSIVGFLLTVLVLSYIFLGDNPLFRLATYAFIGVAAGYIVLVTFTQVFWPKFIVTLTRPDVAQVDKLLMVVPFILSLLLVARLFPKLARAGNISMAFLVGVAAAAIVGGTVTGTLLPQGIAAADMFNLRAGRGQPGLLLLDALVALVGTVATLFFFYFGARHRPNQLPERGQAIELAAQVGQVFIAITLGAVFAGVYASALTALIGRLLSIFSTISLFLARG
jgi:hypothetical protein